MIIELTRLAQIKRLEDLGKIPNEIVRILANYNNYDNPPDHIPDLDDGWNIYLLTEDKDFGELPNPKESTYEDVEKITDSEGCEWICALMINNNESATTYVFKNKLNPSFFYNWKFL